MNADTAVVDMETGLLRGVKTVGQNPQNVLDMPATATHDLYEGDPVPGIETSFKTSRGANLKNIISRKLLLPPKTLFMFFHA